MRRFVLGLLVTVVSVALLIRLIPWSSTEAALRAADPLFIALAVSCLVASLIAKTVRWRLLLPEGSGVSTPRLYRILHISFLLNNVLPARLGDVARVAMTTTPARPPFRPRGFVHAHRARDRHRHAAGRIPADQPLPPGARRVRNLVEGGMGCCGGARAGGVLATAVPPPPRRAIATNERLTSHLPGNERLREEARSFGEGFRQLFSRRHVLPIWGWSWGAWMGAFAINYLLMQALHIEAPIAVAVLLTCTTNLAMLIPSSPGYIGVFHAAATLSLLPFHVASGAALSFAILAHLVNVVPGEPHRSSIPALRARTDHLQRASAAPPASHPEHELGS